MAGIRIRRIPSRCSKNSREVFRADGPFTPLPAMLVKLLELGLRARGLELPIAEGAFADSLVARMLTWRHSGRSRRWP
jgi:hypothetical protein